MKLRLALLSLLGVLFCLTCNTYEPPVVLEYSIDVSWPTTAPIVFKNYTFSIHSGDNKFANIKVYADSAGFIDSSLMNLSLKNNTTAMSGYFLKPGTCTVFIEGLAADQRTFKTSCKFTIRNPYSISGPTQLAIGETGSFRLGPADSLALSGLKLVVNWKENDKSPSPLDIFSPFSYTVIGSGSQKVTAIIVDTVNKQHSYAVDTIEFSVPGHRPAIDSLRIAKRNLAAGDHLSFNLKISDEDTASLKAIISTVNKGVTRLDTIPLSSPLSNDSLFTIEKPFIDTGSYILTIKIIDPSGLASRSITDTFTVTADPPVVTFNPDTLVMNVPYNYNTTLFVTGSAEMYHWSVDGAVFTTTIPQLTQNFLNPVNLKDSATVIVYGIDQYSYNGKPDTLVLHKDTQFYSLLFNHKPGDSAYRDSAYWEVKTPNADRARKNGAKFYWSLISVPTGDTIYRDSLTNTLDSLSRLSIKGLTIPGINLDSIDLSVSVVLKDAFDTLNTSSVLTNTSKIRLFRPRIRLVSVLPSPDSVSTGIPVTITFKASDVNINGFIKSIFWKYADSAAVHGLTVTDSMVTFIWKTAGIRTFCIWAFDNDGQISDTLKPIINVVKNQPRTTGISLKPATVYTKDPCTLSVSVQRGISGAKIDSVLWSCPTWIGPVTRKTTTDAAIPASFATPGRHRITVTLYDSLLDSSSRVDSVNILSGKPLLSIAPILPRNDSISTKVPAVFKYTVSTSRAGFVDSIFWQQAGTSVITGLKVTGNDSTFRITWPDSGHIALRIWARDNIDNPSDTITRNFVIVKNRPSVTALIVPSGTPPSKRAYNYSIVPRRGFSGSRIIGYHWVYPLASGTKDSMRTDSTLSLQFNTPGSKIMNVYVVDSLNDTSAFFIDTITIDQGLPVVTSVMIDTSASGGTGIYINDLISCTISARDTNGTIAAYRAVLRNNTSSDSIIAQGSNPLSLTVPINKEGIYSLRAYAQDTDGLWSNAFPTTPITLTIRAAKPVITGFTLPSGLWIYDTLTFRYSARDTNGGLKKIFFNWGDGSLDSVILSPAKDTVLNRALKHRYNSNGTFTVNVSALDEDNQTTTSPYNVTIDKGLPHVQSTKDTVITLGIYNEWVMDTINFAAKAGDTNGSIVKYLWYLTPPFDAVNPDTVITATNSLIKDRASNFWSVHAGFKTDTTYKAMVKVQDDDGFTAVDTFYIYNESYQTQGFRGDTRCKNGRSYWDGSSGVFDPYWFEYSLGDSTAGYDSIQLSWLAMQIPLEAAQYHHLTLKVIITNGETNSSPIDINDTITIADSVPFLSYMHYIDPTLSTGWRGMWRPPLDFFYKYKNSSINKLNFTVKMTVYRRTGQNTSWSNDFHINSTMW